MSPKDNEITVSLSTPIPKGYLFVRKGDVYLTANCRKKTHESGQQLYVVIDTKKKPIGLRCPSKIFHEVQTLNRKTKSDRRAAVEKKDDLLNQRAQTALSELFPHIPTEFGTDILKHTLKKRSGRVGRATTIPIEKTIDLAVRAFIRHKLTDYDLLLRKGVDRRIARERIRAKSERVADEWAGERVSAPSKKVRFISEDV